MKKLYQSALIYMLLGLTAGLFDRTYVDHIRHFEGATQLNVLHTHLLALGMLVFLIALLIERSFQISRTKWFNLFFWHYHSGVILTTGAMLVHGIMRVEGLADSPAISGIAGLGHILLSAGLIFLFLALKKRLQAKA